MSSPEGKIVFKMSHSTIIVLCNLNVNTNIRSRPFTVAGCSLIVSEYHFAPFVSIQEPLEETIELRCNIKQYQAHAPEVYTSCRYLKSKELKLF